MELRATPLLWQSGKPKLWVRRILLALCATGTLCAQALEVTASKAARGETGSFELVWSTPAGRDALALQWKLQQPPDVVIEKSDITPGKTASAAGKSVACVQVKKPANGQVTFACILAGGNQAIPNGPVAVVKYMVDPKTDLKAAPVFVREIVGVSRDMKPMHVENAAGVIAIQ